MLIWKIINILLMLGGLGGAVYTYFFAEQHSEEYGPLLWFAVAVAVLAMGIVSYVIRWVVES